MFSLSLVGDIAVPLESNYAQTSFASGAVHPIFHNRLDLQARSTMLKDSLNMIPTVSGAMVSRPGTVFIGEAKLNKLTLGVEFYTVNGAVNLLLEIGEGYVRFWKNDALIEVSGSPYELVLPYVESDLSDLRFAQKNDVLFIVHPNYSPRRLNRFADDNWTFTTVANQDGPYLDINLDTANLWTVDNYVSTTFRLTASKSTFASTDVGRQVRFQVASIWYWGTITAFTSATVVTVDRSDRDMPTSGSSTSVWRLGAWSSTLKYPSAICFHDNRLVYGGSPTYPQTFWATVVGTTDRFSPTLRAGSGASLTDTITSASAITATLEATIPPRILWLRSSSDLLIGTAAGLFTVPTRLFKPADIVATLRTDWSCSSVRPFSVAESVYYSQGLGRTLYGLSPQTDTAGNLSYESQDVSVYWKHLLGSSMVEAVGVSSPHPGAWIRCADGSLLNVGIQLDQKFLAWSKHELGGDPDILEMTSFTDRTNFYNPVYFMCRRTLNGTTRVVIEKLSDVYEAFRYGETLALSSVYSDCSTIKTSGSPTTTFTGLSLYNGISDLAVIADGSPVEGAVVSSGTLTLEKPASKVVVGLPYRRSLKTLDIPEGNPRGSNLGQNKRGLSAVFSVFESLGFYLSSDLKADVPKSEFVPVVTENIVRTEALPLFTGTLPSKTVLGAGQTKEVGIELWIDQPTPFTLTAISYHIQNNLRQ